MPFTKKEEEEGGCRAFVCNIILASHTCVLVSPLKMHFKVM